MHYIKIFNKTSSTSRGPERQKTELQKSKKIRTSKVQLECRKSKRSELRKYPLN
jgi:hypothetical protein